MRRFPHSFLALCALTTILATHPLAAQNCLPGGL